jgi:hypothetical protein
MVDYQDILYRVFVLSAFIIGCVVYKKSSRVFKILTFYLGYTLLSEGVSLYFRNSLHNNSPILKIFLLVEIACLGAIYFYLFESRLYKGIVLFLSTAFFIFCICYMILHPEPILPGYLVSTEVLIFIFFSILYYRQLLEIPRQINLLKSGEFWLNSCILINSAGSFAFWLTFTYLWKHHIKFPGLLTVMFALQLLEYSLMGLALYLQGHFPITTDKHYEGAVHHYH